jgi:hypothetical protein
MCLWHQSFTIKVSEATKGARPDMGWIYENRLESMQIGENRGGCGLGSIGIWNGDGKEQMPPEIVDGIQAATRTHRWGKSLAAINYLRIRKMVLWVGMASRKQKASQTWRWKLEQTNWHLEEWREAGISPQAFANNSGHSQAAY